LISRTPWVARPDSLTCFVGILRGYLRASIRFSRISPGQQNPL
jgi:hypothetical protein